MNNIIMAGLANSKTSLGEVFRRYIECFSDFSKPDIFDLTSFTHDKELFYEYYKQYNGPINHNIKYFHLTFNLYKNIKINTKPIINNTKKIGYFVWESNELYKEDSKVFDDFDEIWTASNYCKDVFSQYINSNKIRIIPHPIPEKKETYEKFKNFTILIIANISSNIDRKNIEGNLYVANILKQKYKNIKIIFKTLTASDKERTLLKNITYNQDLDIIDAYYSSKEMRELISKCHVVLSLHRSEGFGLTLAEAQSMDTIPVATNYSGNTDFMKDSDHLINYKLIDISNSYFKGQWADPDVDDAVSKLENIIKGNIKPQTIHKSLTYKNVTETIMNNI